MDRVTTNSTQPAINNLMEGQLHNLKEAGALVQGIRLRARQELEQARKVRAEAERYGKETQAKANGYAQQLLLRTRLATQQEIADIREKAREALKQEIAEVRAKASEELKREIAEVNRRANESLEQEMTDFRQKLDQSLGKILADLRILRITAHEELQTQRKLTDAARIQSLSLEFQEPAKIN